MDLVLRAYTIQHLTRALCQRSGGLLNDPSGKLFVHYYQVFGLTVGAGQEQLFPAFKRMLKSIFLKRDVYAWGGGLGWGKGIRLVIP